MENELKIHQTRIPNRPFLMLPNELFESKQLTKHGIAAYVALLVFNQRGNVCHAPQRDLASVIGVGKDSLRQGILELRANGFVVQDSKHKCLNGSIIRKNSYFLLAQDRLTERLKGANKDR